MKNLSPSFAKQVYTRWKKLKTWQKFAVGILLTSGVFSVTGGTALCAVKNVLDWIGEKLGAYDLEDQEAWNKCEWGVNAEEGTNSECPGEAVFKTAIETAYGGATNVDAAKYGVFDTEKCAGIYDGATYTWDNEAKDWN